MYVHPDVAATWSFVRDNRALLIGLGLFGVASLGGFIWLRRRRAWRAGSLPAHPATTAHDPERASAASTARVPSGDLRRLREALLLATEVTGHGGLAATKVIRRLLWLLEAVETQTTASPETRDRLATTTRDFREITRPQIEHILALGAALHLDASVTERVAAASRQLEGALSEIAAAQWSASAVGARFAQASVAAEEIEKGLRVIRAVARRFVTVSLGPEIDSALAAVSEDAAWGGVEIEAELPVAVRDAIVRASRGDVAVILENLLANALRAITATGDGLLSAAPVSDPRARQIDIRGEQDGCFVVLQIIDSGCGIAEADRERIFERGISSRAGGGTGLYASRELLKNTGGNLQVRESCPGKTVMELRLLLEEQTENAEGEAGDDSSTLDVVRS